MTVAVPPPRPLEEILAGSHPRRAWVDITAGPHAGKSLPITDGQIVEDLASPVRRVGSLTVAGLPEWEPVDATSALDVRSGTELTVWVGVTDDEGHEHTWQQGVFHPSRPSVARDGSGLSIAVDVSDRSHAVSLTRIRRRWAATAGTGIIEAVIEVLGEVAPWLPIDIPLSEDIPLGTDAVLCEYGEDVWEASRVLLDGLGLDLHIDVTGTAVAPAKIDPLTAAPVTLPGLTAQTVSTDVEDVVNVIGCPWEEARPEAAGEDWVPKGGIEEAVDELSSTSIRSPLGVRARAYQGDTSVIHAPPHARLAAQSQLITEMDLQQAASGTMVPHPGVRVGVPVDVDGKVHRVTRLTIDLAGAPTGVDLGASVPDIARMLAAKPRKPERETTEIVTSVAPLRSRPVTEPVGPETSVEWTDALKGVEVGDPIKVRHTGAGRRVGIAIGVHKTITEKHAGERLGTVGGRPFDADGDAQLRVRIGSSSSYSSFSGGDVTLPTPPAGASTTHYHNFSYPSISSAGSHIADAQSNSTESLQNTRVRLNQLIDWANSVRSAFQATDSTGTPQG